MNCIENHDFKLQCFRHEGITLPGFLLVSYSGMDIMNGFNMQELISDLSNLIHIDLL